MSRSHRPLGRSSAACALPDDQTGGLPSPDVADAFVLTFAEVGRGRQKVRRSIHPKLRQT
jgi:hypothetical protein